MVTDEQIEAAAAALHRLWCPECSPFSAATEGHQEYCRKSARIAIEEAAKQAAWLPIGTAPGASVNRGFAKTSETLWVRDADGRVYEAWFVDALDKLGRTYWWDLDGEDECDPVQWMPHPLWTPEE